MSETLGASAGSLGASAGTGMARPDTRANRPQSIDVNAQTQTNKKKKVKKLINSTCTRTLTFENFCLRTAGLQEGFDEGLGKALGEAVLNPTP